MSNIGKFKDKTPFLQQAGWTAAVENLSADNSLRQELYMKVKTSTPEKIKKYRNSTKEQIGVKQIHYGIYDDDKSYENYVHGIKTLGSDHVIDCITNKKDSGVNHFINVIKESKYSSSQREPLGKGLQRNYVFPDKTVTEGFRFGIPTNGYYSSKDLIYARMNQQEDEKTLKMYQLTHGLTLPGEQKDRNYNWPVDKNNHIFGKGVVIEKDGAKKSLRTDLLESEYPKTKIGDKRLEDFRQATSDMLGKSKFKGTLNNSIPQDFTFGVKSLKENNWNVGKCLNGDPNVLNDKMLEVDPDLGKSVTYRSKNTTIWPKKTDYDRIFGVPCVRNDLKMKEQRSVCDLTVSIFT